MGTYCHFRSCHDRLWDSLGSQSRFRIFFERETMIQCYFGNGKGKTTASLGAAVRYAGSGKRVLYIQFLKNNNSSEFLALSQIEGITVLPNQAEYKLFDNLKKELVAFFRKAYTKLLSEGVEQCQKSYDMLVLDEVLDAVSFGYIEETLLIDFLKELKDTKEIILTGHILPDGIRQLSDYISEVKAVKHPYYTGVSPRKGIEY